MKIIEIELEKLTPDPENPNKSVDEVYLNELAKSIATEGIINPIEVDEDFMIVNGEQRWKSAKIAGLKTVPVKVISIDKDKRLMRQVIDNIHKSKVSDWDMANALRKLIDLEFIRRPNKPQGGKPEEGIRWLVQRTGKSLGYISETLNILEQNKEWKKAIQEDKNAGKFTSLLSRTPKQFKEAVQKKFLNSEFITRNGGREFMKALKREQNNPDVAKKLLETDYSKHKGFHEVEKIVAQIAPHNPQVITKIYDPSQALENIMGRFKEWVKNNSREQWSALQAPRIILNLVLMRNIIEEWSSGLEETKLVGKK